MYIYIHTCPLYTEYRIYYLEPKAIFWMMVKSKFHSHKNVSLVSNGAKNAFAFDEQCNGKWATEKTSYFPVFHSTGCLKGYG